MQQLAVAVGEQYEVPEDLILALGWVSTTLSPVHGGHGECSPIAGWIGLRPSQVSEAATHIGLSAQDIESERVAGFLAAAALLHEYRAQLAPEASSQWADASWWPVVERWPGFGEVWLDQEFALAVFEVLQRGLETSDGAGDPVSILPRELPGLAAIELLQAPGDATARDGAINGYPGSHRFVAASPANYSTRPAGLNSIDTVVVHTTEGSYSGAISWFRNPGSGVSAHYVIRRSDGEVTQMVSDERRAWHAGSANDRSIGIEHEGTAANASTWTPQILESSARLSAWLSERYSIPIDRTHFIGHSEVDSSSRIDPGPHFPWSDYLELVKCYRYGGSYCDEGADGGSGDDAPGEDPPGAGSSSGPGSSGGVSCDGGCGGSLPAPGETPAPGDVWVRLVEPRTGQEVANPVAVRAERSGGPWIEFWAGAFRVAASTSDNPADQTVHFFLTGNRSITARLYSDSGVLLDSDTVSVRVRPQRGELTVQPSAVTELTWSFEADVSEVTRPVEFVTYSVDGRTIEDDSSGSDRATGSSFELTHSFESNPHGRLLVARAFDDDSRLLASDSVILDSFAQTTPQCSLAGELSCGDRIDGNTALAPDAANRLDAYPDLPGNYSGPELGYYLDVSASSAVEVRLVNPRPYIVNHDLLLLDAS